MTDERWLIDHLLGEDDDASRELAERKLAADPGLRRRAEELHALVGHLDALPATAWTAAASPDSESAEPEASHPPEDEARGSADRRPKVLALAALVVAVFAVGLGAGALVWSGGAGSAAGSRRIGLVALGPASQARGAAIVESGDRLRLAVSGLHGTSRGEYYEAWLMTSRTDLLPLASFRIGASGAARMNLTLPAVPTSYRYIDISLQRTAAGLSHSRDSVLRGSTAR